MVYFNAIKYSTKLSVLYCIVIQYANSNKIVFAFVIAFVELF